MGKETKKTKNRPLIPILTFILCWLAWSSWQLFILPMIPPGNFASILDSVIVKSAVWVTPVLLISKGYRSIGDAFRTRFPILACLVFLALSAAFLYTVRILNGLQNTHIFFDPVFIVFSVSAGVIEEISFRGGYFDRMDPSVGFIPAALITGVAFTVFHYPELLLGRWQGLISLRALLIFAMGVVFCLMYKKWKNLPLIITVHSVWNILSYLFCLTG